MHHSKASSEFAVQNSDFAVRLEADLH